MLLIFLIGLCLSVIYCSFGIFFPSPWSIFDHLSLHQSGNYFNAVNFVGFWVDCQWWIGDTERIKLQLVMKTLLGQWPNINSDFWVMVFFHSHTKLSPIDSARQNSPFWIYSFFCNSPLLVHTSYPYHTTIYMYSSGEAWIAERNKEKTLAIDATLLDIRPLCFEHEWVNTDPKQGEDRSQKHWPNNNYGGCPVLPSHETFQEWIEMHDDPKGKEEFSK